jgi:hypothetical protein
MHFKFSYNKKQIIQGLRYHFISRREIKLMMILVNVFAIGSAVLFYTKKIRPEPFLLGSFIWVFMMLAVWYILPYGIYSKSSTFKETFTIFLNDENIVLQNHKGEVVWKWNQFKSFFESPNFFHLYFTSKTFFLIPKDEIGDEVRHELRGLFNKHIG